MTKEVISFLKQIKTDMKTHPASVKLRELRLKRGLTQYQLARILGLKHNTVISKYETGRKRPSLITAQRIALALGATVEDIFKA